MALKCDKLIFKVQLPHIVSKLIWGYSTTFIMIIKWLPKLCNIFKWSTACYTTGHVNYIMYIFVMVDIYIVVTDVSNAQIICFKDLRQFNTKIRIRVFANYI